MTHRPATALLAALCCLILPACQDAGPAAGAAGSSVRARPPVPADGAATGVSLSLLGGPFGAKEDIQMAVTPETAKVEVLESGFRLSLAAPQAAGSLEPFAWGFWVFADGPLEEDAVLRCRTGTQLRIDGISFAPVVMPKGRPSQTSHPLDATVTIIEINRDKGLLVAEIAATLVAPDGKAPIGLTGLLKLPWPGVARAATTGE